MDSLKLVAEQIQENPALAGFCAMLGLLVVSWLWPRRTPPKQAIDAEEPTASMLQLQADLRTLAHDLNGQLDSRMRELRTLLNEARTTIDELRDRQGITRQGPPPASPLKDVPQTPTAYFAVPPTAVSENPPDVPRPAARAAAGATMDPAPLRAQRYEHVYSLADAGLDSAEIATETGMLRGEVELVLNLRRKKYRISSSPRPDPKQQASTIEAAGV
jgi:hypothetical protein